MTCSILNSSIYQSGYHVHRQLWKCTSLAASWLIFSHVPLARCFEGDQTGPCCDNIVRRRLRHASHLLWLATYLFIISAYQSTGKLPCNLLQLKELEGASVSVYWKRLTVQEHHSHLTYFFFFSNSPLFTSDSEVILWLAFLCRSINTF